MRLIYSLSQWSLLPLLAASLLLLSQWASAPVSVHALACGATASRSEVIQVSGTESDHPRRSDEVCIAAG